MSGSDVCLPIRTCSVMLRQFGVGIRQVLSSSHAKAGSQRGAKRSARTRTEARAAKPRLDLVEADSAGSRLCRTRRLESPACL